MACGLIFVTARTLFYRASRARLLFWAFTASGILVTSYALVFQRSTGFCWVGRFLKKQTEFAAHDTCLMSGTFVSSNNFGAFCGMALVTVIALMFVEPRRRRETVGGSPPQRELRRFVAGGVARGLALLEVVARSGHVAALGRRAVLLIGDERNRLSKASAPDVIAVNYAPFEALLPRAAAMVHHGGVGTTSSWQSETRPNVTGSSTVTTADNSAVDGECVTVTDVVIIDGQETRAPKRMCRRPPNNRFVRV